MSVRSPATYSLPLAAALDRSEPLHRLLARLHDSRARFDAILPALPPALQPDIRPGPFEDSRWTLLAANAAAAAKLRQLLPQLEQRLAERGWEGTAIKVRVQPRPSE